jgi:glucose/mannose-6-phosphate isomerase
MLQKVIEFPNQVADAYSLQRQKDLPLDLKRKYSSIVILGMGGSAISGDFARILLRNCSLPVHVCKNSSPPAYVNDATLVIAITYSGKTRETLEALEQSMTTGAQCIVITSSSELGSDCEKKRIPWIYTRWNMYSRASLGYLLVPLLRIFEQMGLLKQLEADISEAVSVLNQIRSECSPNVPVKKNPAHLLAQELVERLPIIYGENNFSDVVALRWKQQFNENSKVHCYHDVFPELLHNEIEVWDVNTSRSSTMILLRDVLHEKKHHLLAKIETSKYLAESKGAKVVEVWSRGESELARLLSLSYIVDFVSVYLAAARGVDPSVIQNIDYMKHGAIQVKAKEVK